MGKPNLSSQYMRKISLEKQNYITYVGFFSRLDGTEKFWYNSNHTKPKEIQYFQKSQWVTKYSETHKSWNYNTKYTTTKKYYNR